MGTTDENCCRCRTAQVHAATVLLARWDERQPPRELGAQPGLLIGVLRHQYLVGGLGSSGNRIRHLLWSIVGVPFVQGDDRVEGIVHREVHDRERALSFKRQELVFSDGNVVCELIPGDDNA